MQEPQETQVWSPGRGHGTLLQHSCLENPMDGGAWWAAVHGVAESQTRLSDFPFTFHFHALEKEMATHSSVLAWRIPGTGEPGGLSSMGSHRVEHDWSDSAAGSTKTNIDLTEYTEKGKEANDYLWWTLEVILVIWGKSLQKISIVLLYKN